MAEDVITIRNKKTGQRARVHWNEKRPPTKAEARTILQESHERAKSRVEKSSNAPLNLSPIEKFWGSVGDVVTPIANKVGSIKLPFMSETVGGPPMTVGDVGRDISSSPYLPNIHNLVRATEGAKRLVTGTGLEHPEEVLDPSVDPSYYREREQPVSDPRMHGARELTEGALGLGSVFLPAAGGSLRGLAGVGAGEGAAAGVGKVLPPTTGDPEEDDKRAIMSLLGGLAVGGATSHFAGGAGEQVPEQVSYRPRATPENAPAQDVTNPTQVTAPPQQMLSVRPLVEQVLESEILPPTHGVDTDIYHSPSGLDQIPFDWTSVGKPADFDPFEGRPKKDPYEIYFSKEERNPTPIDLPVSAYQDVTNEQPLLEAPAQEKIAPEEDQYDPTDRNRKPLLVVKKTVPTEKSAEIPKPKSERANHIDNYFNTLDALSSDYNDTFAQTAAEHAKSAHVGPLTFEEDLRNANVPPEKIDDLIKQHYPAFFEDAANELEDDSTQLSMGIDPLAIRKIFRPIKPKKPKESMSIPTGIVSSFAHKLRGRVSPVDEFLSENEFTKPIVQKMRQAYFGGEQAFRYDIYKKYAEHMKSYKGDKKIITDYLDGVPGEYPASVKRTGDRIRSLLDYTYDKLVQSGATNRYGQPPRYMRDYISHIRKEDSLGGVVADSVKHLFGGPKAGIKERLFGSEKATAESGQGSGLDFQEPNVSSPFVQRRYGSNDLLQRDPDIIMRRYIDASARLIHRKPVVDFAKKQLDKMPQSWDKEVATWHVKKFAGLPDDAGYDLFFKSIDRAMAKSASRSLLTFSSRLQILHAARLIYQGYPELGEKAMLAGMTRAISDPRGSYVRAVRAGLLPSQVMPRRIQTGSEIFDNIINFGDAGNMAAKIIMNEANLSKGLDPVTAATETARQEGFASPVSPIGLEKQFPKIALMFQDYKFRYGNLAGKAFADAFMKRDPESWMKLGRYIGTAVGLYYIGKSTGIRLWHFMGSNLLSLETPQVKFLENLSKSLYKGDFERAGEDLLRFSIPGGLSMTRRDKRGNLHVKLPTIFDESSQTVRRVRSHRPRIQQ